MKKIIKEVYPYILIIVIVVLIRTFIFTPVTVDGPSMNDTLQDGNVIILNKVKLSDLKRYDIIVFKKNNEKLIKRLLALPGEKIKCVSGIVYVNNEEIENSFAKGKTADFQEYILGDDEYFAVGDNRENSYDSRYFGPIKGDTISGNVKVRLFPFNQINFDLK